MTSDDEEKIKEGRTEDLVSDNLDTANVDISKEDTNYEEKYFRSLADMENMRKRLLKEQKDFAKIALERFVKTILEPLDNLENALTLSLSANEEVRSWLVGFEMIKQQFVDSLTSQGIVSYEAKDGFFDPTIHEAIETVCDNSIPRGTIIKQFAKGYKMGNKVIRPAKVTVSSLGNEAKKEEEVENNT